MFIPFSVPPSSVDAALIVSLGGLAMLSFVLSALVAALVAYGFSMFFRARIEARVRDRLLDARRVPAGAHADASAPAEWPGLPM